MIDARASSNCERLLCRCGQCGEDEAVGRAVERMWQRCFVTHGRHPST